MWYNYMGPHCPLWIKMWLWKHVWRSTFTFITDAFVSYLRNFCNNYMSVCLSSVCLCMGCLQPRHSTTDLCSQNLQWFKKTPNLDYILSEMIDQLHMTKAIITISIWNTTYYIYACLNTYTNSFFKGLFWIMCTWVYARQCWYLKRQRCYIPWRWSYWNYGLFRISLHGFLELNWGLL